MCSMPLALLLLCRNECAEALDLLLPGGDWFRQSTLRPCLRRGASLTCVSRDSDVVLDWGIGSVDDIFVDDAGLDRARHRGFWDALGTPRGVRPDPANAIHKGAPVSPLFAVHLSMD
jgi:hypothetical protein